MTSVHLFNIDKLRQSFNDNMHILHTILDQQIHLKENLDSLKTNYSNMIQKNKKKIFIFCLDSYYFQYKMLLVEMENINTTLSMIKNRIYGDYHKLYNVILSESNIHLEDYSAKFKKYVPYKDIEPLFEYKSDDVISLHNDILQMINLMYNHYLQKELKTIEYNQRQTLTVENFIETLNHDNTTFKGQISLYVDYLKFYHKLQKNHLDNLSTRINTFKTEIEEQTILNSNITTIEENNEYKEKILSYLNTQNINIQPTEQSSEGPTQQSGEGPTQQSEEDPPQQSEGDPPQQSEGDPPQQSGGESTE
jgi:hypothetical protein